MKYEIIFLQEPKIHICSPDTFSQKENVSMLPTFKEINASTASRHLSLPVFKNLIRSSQSWGKKDLQISELT